jgi:hypothetical protein
VNVDKRPFAGAPRRAGRSSTGACARASVPDRALATTVGGQVGEGRVLVLVPGSQPWYATPLAAPALDRRELEDEHSRVLSQAVGDHLPYELVLLAAQLQRTP